MAAEQGHLFIGRNDDTTTAARTQGWDIFSPNWDFVSRHPVLPLISLVALSVGLHPYFADPAWVFSVAMPYFSGEERDECCPLDDHELGLRRCEALSEFLSRALSAPENIVPKGTLRAVRVDEYQKLTMVRVADFVSWAEGCRWELPPEFPRPVETAATQPEAPRPVPRLRAQEEQILAALTDLGFDPLNLPAYPAGKESAAKQHTKAVVEMTDTVAAGNALADGRDTHLPARLINIGKGYIPGQNLWYTKAATDHIIFQNAQEALSPGYLANMRARTQREFGQGWWWQPGEFMPERAPDWGNAAGR